MDCRSSVNIAEFIKFKSEPPQTCLPVFFYDAQVNARNSKPAHFWNHLRNTGYSTPDAIHKRPIVVTSAKVLQYHRQSKSM